MGYRELLDRQAHFFHQCTVYSNSVLATLNARIAIRGLGEDSDELSFSLQTMTKSGQATFNTSTFLVQFSLPSSLSTDLIPVK